MKGIILFLFLAACSVQPPYEPFHMELLSYLYTSTQELQLHCYKESAPEISDFLYILRKNSVFLKNHTMGLNIIGDFDYSIDIWKSVKLFDETYKRQNRISKFFCLEQIILLQRIIKKSMSIEALRKNG